MAARLKRVVGNLVSRNQSAFIEGRNIADGVLVVNEVLDFAKREKRSCVVLKVDFEKAYDRVSWNFVRNIFKRMAFGDRWMRWMECCIFNNSISVLVNGSATKEFKVEKGLRQGDPLSPFVFVLVMEALTALMKKSKEIGEFRGFRFNNGYEVDLLQLADDTSRR
ncbi:secreted RxLR effector protein 78-like [Vicia villosa]|uniref:secreted RxLR effector protein 78-like n=1 Tax=Vicia villosa TaxID=3911 RepID=UPI00273B65F2|nr:secreted RxLR effector protein 78-like [Vicia villosa]